MDVNELNIIIENQNLIEIEYCKSNEEVVTLQIRPFDFYENNGHDYVRAYCSGNVKEYTFRIDKINSMKQVWIDTYDKNDLVPQSGLYIFACKADNHIEYESYRLEKGERLWKYFIDDFTHYDGYFDVIPLAYHFIGLYACE